MSIYQITKNVISKSLGLFFSQETLFFWRSPDKYLRYNEIIKLIKQFTRNHQNISILDVGGGDEGLCDFLSSKDIRITILDISKKELEPARKKGYKTVLADASKKIPFNRNSFDIVTSVASLEHVPPERREKYCDELRRVAKSKVFLYVQSGKIAEQYDKKLYQLSKSIGISDPWTAEHIKYGLPSDEDLQKYFPDAQIDYIQNAKVWYITILLTRIPLVNLILPGLVYSIFLKGFDRCNPLIGAVVVWNKKK